MSTTEIPLKNRKIWNYVFEEIKMNNYIEIFKLKNGDIFIHGPEITNITILAIPKHGCCVLIKKCGAEKGYEHIYQCQECIFMDRYKHIAKDYHQQYMTCLRICSLSELFYV